MAVRIRQNGMILCAALNKAEKGDIYIDDGLHYNLAVERKILVTTPNEYHMKNGGEWWWVNQVPEGVTLSEFYEP